ncbi:MAG: glycerophosphodiester phosphodiesterase [Dehalococcoidia bacterium]|nr:glycerophosphodiester phosphodiesterase [Dehalococcoidia bacterium]
MPVPESAFRPATQQRPCSIAHRAGNNLHALEGALAIGADAIECDLWHYHGKLSLRHERKLPALPILYDRWYIRWSWGVLGLRELLRAIDGRTRLFLDIKSRTPRAADAVLDLYRENASMMPETSVSSHEWALLDRLGRASTSMRMFYSVKNRAGLDALRRRVHEAYPPAGTSIRHTLLSAAVVDELHDAGLEVYAWTVNNPHRAQELIGWGVDGVIADNLDVLKVARAVAGEP